jgi:cytochrome P450 family 4
MLSMAHHILEKPWQPSDNFGIRPYFLLLLDKYGSLNDRFVDELLMVTIASYESSARLLANVLFQLGSDARLQDEIFHCCSVPRDKSVSVLQSNPKLFSLIQEVLRLWPITPQMTMDVTCNSGTVLGTTELECGDKVVVVIDEMHRDPNYWPSPQQFLLDRFHGDCTNGRSGLPYAPFGAGTRICPGRLFSLIEVAELVALFVLRYDVLVVNKENRAGRLFSSLGDDTAVVFSRR